MTALTLTGTDGRSVLAADPVLQPLKESVMSTTTTSMTADEYARLQDHGVPMELVRGEVVEMNQPWPRHGQICSDLTFPDHLPGFSVRVGKLFE